MSLFYRPPVQFHISVKAIYTQLQKKRTTYMHLPLSKIFTDDSYFFFGGYIALKFCMLFSNQYDSLWVKFRIFYEFYFQRL